MHIEACASPYCHLQVTIFFCRGCGRYLQPPRHWVRAELESRELLTFCIKRIRGLGKVQNCYRLNVQSPDGC
jgi:NMD protein affecting ribosome stability and mRNA decay